MQKLIASTLATLLIAGTLPIPALASGNTGETATPIKHLVVIFQENVSFDHYFATYPYAVNPKGEPRFSAAQNTPTVNGLLGALLEHNPNLTNSVNGKGATNPFRLDRSQAATADQDHDYGPEQKAFDHGLMDAFPFSVGTAGPPPTGSPITATTGLTMGYYDGNTVTGYWNYAQQYAMSDNSYDTNFGPSTDGAVNLISGQLNGVIDDVNPGGATISDGGDGLTLISDADPVGDVCSTTSGELVRFGGKNIGDLLNAHGISWGFFEGGFDLQAKNANGTTGCNRTTTSKVTNTNKADYIPHHEPFQYYTSTANPTHARPSSKSAIGFSGDAANHQYDTQDFFDAINAGNFPAVSYLKAPGFEDGHAGYSDPLDEQNFVVTVINFLQKQRDWDSTAVVIAYDDSDGWYDHQIGPIVNASTTAADALTGPGACGDGSSALPGISSGTEHAQGRCGYGPRLPLLVISPWSKHNFVDHTVTDQSSILRFVEDNWLGGERVGQGSFDTIANPINNMFNFDRPENSGRYQLDPGTGQVVERDRGINW
ncbi:phospholipase C [Acidicapsa ligni]|uniref:phospholipase C n=1 Tax=Acidicapsa ligni TaxID=542300 RepID=UPI0021E01666|nr:alkaline phosphatase family protein [Acidicapsa ligni]